MAAWLGLSGHDQLHHFATSPAWDDGPLWCVPTTDVKKNGALYADGHQYAH